MLPGDGPAGGDESMDERRRPTTRLRSSALIQTHVTVKTCDKCGAARTAAAVAWHEPTKCHHDRGEHLHMTCACGFEWLTPTNDSIGHGPLTDREIQVITSAGQGMSNLEIAHALSISEATIKNHFTHIFHKLGVSDRTGAVVYAIRRGWLTV